MPQCKKCRIQFPNWIMIDGKRRNLSKRKYCPQCSLFGLHNTKKLDKDPKSYKCSCGENDPARFYGNKNQICARCQNAYNVNKGQEKRLRALRILGNKCASCGFDDYSCSLEFHHVNPEEKDPTFYSMRFWSWARIEREIKGCVILCSNCHRALHSGHDIKFYGT